MQNVPETRWSPGLLWVIGLIGLAALSRLLPHPPNVTPIEAMGLFAGAYLSARHLAYVVPLAAMFLSDLILGLHSGMPVIYLLIAFNVWLGLRLGPSAGVGRIAGYGLLAASVFFLVSNFAVWATGGGLGYPMNLSGLIACYVAAIPFFGYSLLGMAVYGTVLFGAARMVPALRRTAAAS